MAKKKIIAAGGLVYNEKEELLMIFRRDKWDLPKGKLDEGETIEACAVREVEEETGVQQIQLGALIGITLHEYFDKYSAQDVVKETHWYAMRVKGVPQLIPQTEEDITEIQWASSGQVQQNLQNSYANIVEIVTRYLK